MEKVFSQEDIHRFFLKTSIIVAAFLVTSILTQMLNLASFERKAYEIQAVSQAEVNFYLKQDELLPAEKLKFNISSAKLEVAQETVKINQAMVDLVKSITELCMIISPAFFILGVFFWLMYLPYIPIRKAENKPENITEGDQPSPSVEKNNVG